MPRRCRGISLPPSRRSRDTSASLRYAQPSVSTGPPRRGRQEFRACGRGGAYGAMHPKGTCSASLHCVGIAPYRRLQRVRSYTVSPSGASRHLPRRGRHGIPRLRARRGDVGIAPYEIDGSAFVKRRTGAAECVRVMSLPPSRPKAMHLPHRGRHGIPRLRARRGDVGIAPYEIFTTPSPSQEKARLGGQARLFAVSSLILPAFSGGSSSRKPPRPWSRAPAGRWPPPPAGVCSRPGWRGSGRRPRR